MAQGNNKKSTGISAEPSSRQLQSRTKSPKFLKPGPKIVKKSSNQNFGKIKEAQGTSRSREKTQGKKKSIQEGNKETNTNERKDKEKLKPREGNREKSVTNEKHKEKDQTYQKDKDKLGGLVFMCNAKTKPDCFRYHVMGVSMNKQELVMGIKPGLELFLYDFDLKLMYGMYKASSAGGMKLEPAAFAGAFPVQVRFKVYKDCYPLPESSFKNAIKDNYNEKTHKFKMELTVQQVRNLTELFRPAPPGPLVHAPSVTTLLAEKTFGNAKEAQPQAHMEPLPRGVYCHDQTRRYRMPYDHEWERAPKSPTSTYGDVASIKKETVPQDPLFLSEREYRTYGLGRERFPSTATATLDRYTKDHEREQLPRHRAPMHTGTASTQNLAIRPASLFLSEKEYRANGLGVSRELPSSTPPATATAASTLDPYQKDPHYSYQYGTTSLDSYSFFPRRGEGASSEPYLLGRREAYISDSSYTEGGTTKHSQWREAAESEKLYSTYASSALSDYNLTHHNTGRLDLASGPVSSRYSFAGPSLSYC